MCYINQIDKQQKDFVVCGAVLDILLSPMTSTDLYLQLIHDIYKES